MKFVKITNHNLQSLYTEELGEYAIQYKLNEFVYPRRGSIFCYLRNKDDQYLEWIGQPYNRRAFECEVLNPVFYDRLWIPSLLVAKHHIGSVVTRSDSIHYWCVKNVVLGSAVKLTKEIRK